MHDKKYTISIIQRHKNIRVLQYSKICFIYRCANFGRYGWKLKAQEARVQNLHVLEWSTFVCLTKLINTAHQSKWEMCFGWCTKLATLLEYVPHQIP